MLATDPNKEELFRLLLENGGDSKAIDRSGQTTLMHGVLKENSKAVELLLARGATVNARDKNGMTALDYAKNQNTEEGRRLLGLLRNAGAIE
jgi:ankyrin repeat protein